MSRLVALLRGINVGGKNIIRMADLRAAFEEEGFLDVGTYIQSGNVVFRVASGEGTGRAAGRGAWSAASRSILTRRIERILSDRFDYSASIVLRTGTELGRVVKGAPHGFGSEPETYRYDVAFLKDSLTAASVLEGVPTREGVDRAWAGKGVLYLSRLASRASQSRLSRLASLPIYREMTIRNWNTTTALLEMMEG